MSIVELAGTDFAKILSAQRINTLNPDTAYSRHDGTLQTKAG
jgi:hypothetical protein